MPVGHRREKRRKEEAEEEEISISRAVGLIINGSTEDDLEQYVSQLGFRSFEEQLTSLYSESVIRSINNMPEEDMINHVQSMERVLERHASYHSLLQHLQIFRQLECLSQLRDEHVLNTAKWLEQNGRTAWSIRSLREIISVGWAVYRYPVLGQVKLNWVSARSVIPVIAQLLDKKVNANESLPANVVTAQQSRLDAPYLRISLEFPDTPPGDGDGLCSLKVTHIHGMYVNDRKVDDFQRVMLLRKSYPSEFAQLEGVPADRIEKRSRLLGFDTQEAPRDPGRMDCDVPQPFWREGKQFLEQQLNDMKGQIPTDQAIILGDCYGVDIYGRMLLDIRAVYDSDSDGGVEPVPTLRRLEMAEKALHTGYAFPTNHYFVTDALWQAFQVAVREEKGGFGSELPMVHPSECRRKRHLLLKKQRRQRRSRYCE